MLHRWAQATDVRVVLFDYRKAFDLIDHQILVRKIFNLSIPRSVACWVADFLMHRQQCVKLSADCCSEWGSLQAGIPQSTQLGPWLFLLMINRPKGPWCADLEVRRRHDRGRNRPQRRARRYSRCGQYCRKLDNVTCSSMPTNVKNL